MNIVHCMIPKMQLDLLLLLVMASFVFVQLVAVFTSATFLFLIISNVNGICVTGSCFLCNWFLFLVLLYSILIQILYEVICWHQLFNL